MNTLNLIQLIIVLLQGVLSATTKAQLPQEIIASIQAAIVSLQQVVDTEVTFKQLEGIRTEPQW